MTKLCAAGRAGGLDSPQLRTECTSTTESHRGRRTVVSIYMFDARLEIGREKQEGDSQFKNGLYREERLEISD